MRHIVLPAVLICGLTTTLFGGIGDFVKDAVKVVTAPVVVPAQTLVNAAQAATGNKPASVIFEPAKNAASSAANVVSQGTDIVSAPRDFVLQEAQKLAAKTGPAGEVIFDVATFSDRLQGDLMKSQGHVVANLLRGENPFQIVAVPLAAAIREGRQRHITKAIPLPSDVLQGLAPFFPPQVLQRAKYTTGKMEITLPNGIGKTISFMGGGENAVVVDDVIVFPHDPGSFAESMWWWAHEVTHVQQYLEWGIEEFALRYIRGYKEVEGEADRRGNTVLERAQAGGTATARSIQAAQSHKDDHVLLTGKKSPPLLPQWVITAQAQGADPAAADAAIIQCVFPNDMRPVNFVGTQSGKIIVVDRFTGQWVHIGFALPPQIPGVAWHYSAPGAFYDVLPSGQIMLRTPFGPQQAGFVVRLR